MYLREYTLRFLLELGTQTLYSHPVVLIVFQFSSYAILCSAGISGILKYTFWHHFVFLATSSSSWLTQAFFVVLNIQHLLVHSFLIRFALKSFSYLEYEFFLLYKLLHCFLIPVCFPFPTSFGLVPSYCSFGFLPIMWFLLPVDFL